MKLHFSDQPLPASITHSMFLAGPSPRNLNTHDWRHLAVEYLRNLNFQGDVFIPCPQWVFYREPRGCVEFDYLGQVQWELDARKMSDCIVFWVPRDIQGGLPGFTTNVEFGEELSSGKIFYGRPDSSEKNRYLDAVYQKALNKPPFVSLYDLLATGIDFLKNPALRQGAETRITLRIWNHDTFKIWYSNLVSCGNSLVSANVLHTYNVRDNLFSYIVKVGVYIADEQRVKADEFVFYRQNISSVVAYHKPVSATSFLDYRVVFVEEFRSAVNNSNGKVIELPSGSSFKDHDLLNDAYCELGEETGLWIADLTRFVPVNTRQYMATLCAQTSSVFKVELAESELALLDSFQQKGVVNGDASVGERTYLRVMTVAEAFNCALDYSTLGMVVEALTS